jgi:hypothetical protein
MKNERSHVDHPLWRKKVDSSLFNYNGTTVPAWAVSMWGLDAEFAEVYSKTDEMSAVAITFERQTYYGWVTVARKGRVTPAYRLWFEDALLLAIKRTFLMSYMRDLEARLRSDGGKRIEEEIAFWEFLDIEYDRTERVFRFVAHYPQKPTFPELFARLVGSPAIRKIDDEISSRGEMRIYREPWKPREQLEFELGAENVLYVLADTATRLLYVGEAKKLVARLSQSHPSIPKWNYYRYAALPEGLAAYRKRLEQLLIWDMASIMPSKSGVEPIDTEGYRLTNYAIDRR